VDGVSVGSRKIRKATLWHMRSVQVAALIADRSRIRSCAHYSNCFSKNTTRLPVSLRHQRARPKRCDTNELTRRVNQPRAARLSGQGRPNTSLRCSKKRLPAGIISCRIRVDGMAMPANDRKLSFADFLSATSTNLACSS